MRYHLKGCRVIDPAQALDGIFELLIEQGSITAIAPRLRVDDAVVVELAGKIVVPGFVDLHVHLREPGFEPKETIASGVAAAVAGGITAVACMPNTEPTIDCAAVSDGIRRKADAAGLARVYPVGALTRGRRGRSAADFEGLYRSGVRAFSDDGSAVADSGLFRRILKELARYDDALVIAHSEDRALAAGGVIHAGALSRRCGLSGIPAVAETVAVARDILLARDTGVRLHLAHLSTAGSLELLDWARGRGLPVTAEVTPHHLLLNENTIEEQGSLAKVNPPLRTEADRLALCRALKDGLIDIIATDHAPHTASEKSMAISEAPFGITGLETAIPLLITELVHKGLLTLADLVRAYSYKPAQLLGIPAGTIRQGAPADLTVLDLEASAVVDPRKFYSYAKHSPFAGRPLLGLPVMTMVRGDIKMDKGVVFGAQKA